MHLFVYVLLILLSCVSFSDAVFCVTKCDCNNINLSDDVIIVNGVTDCCDATATPAKGNLLFNSANQITDCTLCPLCGDQTTCEINPITTVYSANVTRPAAGKSLFTISGVTYNCPGQPESTLQFFYSRGSTNDDLFTTVGASSGTVSVVLVNAPTFKRTYTGSVTIQLLKDTTSILAQTSVPFTFVLFDAIEPDATVYAATTTNSRVGGLYLFTAGTSTTGFTVVFSIKLFLGDYNSISINSTSGLAFTSETSPPTATRTYQGVVLFTYTSDSGGGSPVNGQIEVLFSFQIINPLTPSPTFYSIKLAFPFTPSDVTAFVVSFDFVAGFDYASFTYDFIDGANLLNINHLTRTLSFPFKSDTEIKRYPDSGVTVIVISYFSVEMYNQNEPVYKGLLTANYDLTVVDPCGFSFNATAACANEGNCTLNGISFTCACPVFFTGTVCDVDVNECLDTNYCNTGSCTNTNGGFICTCTSGFTGVRCATNVDECLIVPPVCLHGGVCSDTVGSYSCDCTGTGYSGVNCEVNINECDGVSNLCGTGVCHDNNGSYVCDCNGTGFRGTNCGDDIDECVEQPGLCQNEGLCINTNGSYLCDCTNTGFVGNNCEENFDECNETSTLCLPGKCVDSVGSFSCNCSGTGFTGSNCTTDINECSSNSSKACLNEGVCSNTNGGFDCDCTNTGYKGLLCAIDVNECLIVPPVCENNGNCFNTNGGYSCNCNNTGYTGSNCETNVDECNVTSNICSTGQCFDTEGDYTCNCNGTGFEGKNCNIDVNECNLLPSVCLNGGVCSNSVGSYSCDCSGTGYTGFNTGYTGFNTNYTGFNTGYTGFNCGTDVNECAENSTICNNGTCLNSNGSYNCNCTVGFTGVNCESDVDECDTAGICNNGTCSNTQGSFTCSCDEGYTGVLCNADVNECDTVTDLCSVGTCVNSIGSYACNCANTGFRGDNCRVDINECAENATLCNHGNCTNINGSYFCTCFPGFTGTDCETDINECLTTDICNFGTCVNVPGTYSCNCQSGYTGPNCNVMSNGTVVCPSGKECTNDSDCSPCLCHRNFTYLEPVYVLLSEPLTFDGNVLLPFEREVQPELSGDVTIFAKLRQTYPDQGYVMFIGSSTSYRNLGLFLDSNASLVYLFYTQAGASSYSTIEVSLDLTGTTHTLAVVLNFTDSQAHFYKDGTLEVSVSLPGTPDYKLGERKNSRVMFVGGRIENLFKFFGWIGYLFLYPFCLTEAQIQSLHQNGPVTYSGVGKCQKDVTSDTYVPRPFYKPSVPTQHHSYASKTRCDVTTHYSVRGLTGVYTCWPSNSAVECSTNTDCASGYTCGEYLSRDGHSFLPAVFDPYFHGFKYALVETETTFNGVNPITISITKRPILTLDLTIFVKFKQNSNNEGYLVAKGVSAHARDFGLYLRGTSNTVWFVYKSKSGFHDYAIFSNITVDDGQTHTIAVVLLQTDNFRFVYLYVDGLPRGYVKINNRVVFTPEVNSLTVGGRPGTDKFNFDGVIYKLHIFDVALTFPVISDLHKAFTNNLLVRYCTPLQTSGDPCYIERRPPFFKCGSDLGCVPTPYFNRSIPVLPQQNLYYGAPYTLGQCLSCDCPTPALNQLVCGTNGVTYANSCFLACGGSSELSQGACESYAVRFSNTVTGE